MSCRPLSSFALALAVAALTLREGRRQAALVVTVGVLGAALLLSPHLIFFGFGEETLLIEEMGASTLRLAVLAVAIVLGAATVARDRAEGGFGSVLLARPLSKTSWLAGRFLGALGAGIVTILVLGVPFALALRSATAPTPSLASALPAVAAALAGAGFVAFAITAIAVACGVLLPAGAAALGTFIMFALGHLRAPLARVADGPFAGSLLSILVPDLGHVGASGAAGRALSAGPLGGAALAAFLAAAAYLALAAAVMEGREVR